MLEESIWGNNSNALETIQMHNLNASIHKIKEFMSSKLEVLEWPSGKNYN